MGVGISMPKWRASKLIIISMMNNIVYALMRVKENYFIGKSMGLNEPI